MKKNFIRIIVALVLFVAVFTIDQIFALETIIGGQNGFLLPLFLYLGIYLLIGYDVLWKAIRNVGRGQFFDENFLMALATLGAFALAINRGILGEALEGFDEACAVLIFYQIGEWFQKYATGKSRQSIAALMDLRPDYANLQTADGLKTVDPTEIAVGDIIVVNPGEKIALDGIIISGTTSVDTKSITGETMPQTLAVGDAVISGCVNLTSQIKVRVDKIFYDSTVSKILDLVENAALKKSKSENFITKFARYYTPAVVFGALLCAVVCGLITADWGQSVYRALSFLVVSCPCALVISVPMAFFVALGTASRNGVLIKGSNYLEKFKNTRTFVFDKTGTITKGNFMVTKVIPESEREVILQAAAIAENHSSHPIAQAIMQTYGQDLPEGYTVTNVAGAGVIAIKGQAKIYCGNAKLLQAQNIVFTPLKDVSGTVAYVAKNQTYLGAIIIQDEIKPEAARLMHDLTNLGCQTIMLTGDREAVARQVAAQVKVTDYRAELLPQDKVACVEELLSPDKKETVCFVGDGINDAPVLMRADIGVAMGTVGSDAALEAADIVLMHDDLDSLIFTKRLAHKTMRVVSQNIIFSLGIKMGILALAAFGIANMWMAVFGDVGVAMLAIINSLRLNTTKKRVN